MGRENSDVWDRHIHTSIYKRGRQGPAVEDRELNSGSRSDLMRSKQTTNNMHIQTTLQLTSTEKLINRALSGGPVVKNKPSNAGDTGAIPGQGTETPHAGGN